MNMGRAARMAAVHTVRGCHLSAILDMATPVIWSIWSRYHHRLPFTFGAIVLVKSCVSARLICVKVRLRIGLWGMFLANL